MSKDTLYVLAGDDRQAALFAWDRGYHHTRYINVDCREKIMGLRNIVLYVVGTAASRENFHEIVKEAQIREIKMVYV